MNESVRERVREIGRESEIDRSKESEFVSIALGVFLGVCVSVS